MPSLIRPRMTLSQRTRAAGSNRNWGDRFLRAEKREQQQKQIVALRQAIQKLSTETNSSPKTFAELPLSEPTQKGLKKSHFEKLTDIQAKAIPAILQDVDLLAAAKTGSGKTLAFLVPMLEKLFREQWTTDHGLGALIISPTRELAIQTFEVLRKIGRYHSFSAGLVVGGMDVEEEAPKMAKMNILVCTPGRILQHLDQTAEFEVNNLQMLVLDEADRIMDMGFRKDVDAIIDHLPKTQTLLFSATQSKKVSDLARLSMKDPKYLAVHQMQTTATPQALEQYYLQCPLAEKISTLYGFLTSNRKRKIVVFFSSSKQVRFVYESFRHLQPGISLLQLHGRAKQAQRIEITRRFTEIKAGVLFATDVVARGMDFPSIDWVLQVDAPEDVDTYIHRVGRTARNERGGKAVMLLDPSEINFIQRLTRAKVPITEITVKSTKKADIQDQLQKMCWERHDVKYLAQKSFISYVRSIHLQKDKMVFDLDKLDLEAFAKSLGLAGAPKVHFHKGIDAKKLKNAPRQLRLSDSESDMDLDGPKKPKKKDEVKTKVQKMFDRTNQDVLSKHYADLANDEASSDNEPMFKTKRVLRGDDFDDAAGKNSTPNDISAEAAESKTVQLGKQDLVIDSKRREKLLKSKKKLLKFRDKSTKLVFDDDGVARPIYQLQDEEDFQKEGPASELREKFVEEEAGRVAEQDVDDKAVAKRKRVEKKLKRKARERGEDAGKIEIDEDAGVEFGSDGEDGLALLRSLPTPGEGSWGESEEEERPKKKAKNETKPKRRDLDETLEDLEARAALYLD